MPTITTLTNFSSATGSPNMLSIDAAGDLLGTTQGPGSGGGEAFEIMNNGGTYASTPNTLVNFTSTLIAPDGDLTADAAGNLFSTTVPSTDTSYASSVLEIAKTANGYANTATTIATFNVTDGEQPEGGLITDAAGDFFGTTEYGGKSFDGTVFEITNTASGYASAPTVLLNFNGTNGQYPLAGLVADAAGDLFGESEGGSGSIFEIAKTPSGYASTPTTLVNFNVTDETGPQGGLIMDAAGDLFGTTSGGGGPYGQGDGTVFEIAKTATGYASIPTTLAYFNGTDGNMPMAGLIMDAAGDLFGTTEKGGANGSGTVFEIAKGTNGYNSTPITVVSFTGTNGANPVTGLVADAAGDIFGTTSTGGTTQSDNNGTVFEITQSGYQTVAGASGSMTTSGSGSGSGSTANLVAANLSASGTLGTAVLGQQDWYSFVVTGTQDVAVSLSSESNNPAASSLLEVSLFDSKNDALTKGAGEATATTAEAYSLSLNPGTYYAEVFGDNTSYLLDLSSGIPAVGTAMSDSAGHSLTSAASLGTITSTATTVTGGVTQEAFATTTVTPASSDYYSFAVGATSSVQLTLVAGGGTSGVDGELLNATGTVLANFAADTIYDSLNEAAFVNLIAGVNSYEDLSDIGSVNYTLSAGTYTIELAASIGQGAAGAVVTSGGYDNYSLTVSATPISSLNTPTIVDNAGASQASADGLGTLSSAGTISSGTGTISTGTNSVSGGSGSTTVSGSSGSNTMSGGSGSTTTSGNTGSTATSGSSGSTTASGGSGSTTTSSSSGSTTTSGGSGSSTISGGSGSTTTSSASGSSTISGNTGSTTVSGGGTPTVDAGSAVRAFTVPAGASEFVTSEGNNTIYATTGAPTISASAGNTVVFAGNSSLDFIGGSGAATVIGGTAGNTVQGGSGSLVLFAVSPTLYTSGTGASTIIGGAGGLTATLGAGGGEVFGGTGGVNTLSVAAGSTGNAALVGIGDGDVVTDAGTGSDILVAGAGAETLNAAASSGNLDAFFGGSGDESMAGGSGQSFFLAGTGNETLTGGEGLNEFVFLAGSTARTEIVNNFNAGDLIGLFGYSNNQPFNAYAASVYASAVVTSSGTTLTLSDNTKVVLAGFTHLSQANILSA